MQSLLPKDTFLRTCFLSSNELFSGPLHTIASMIKRQKCLTARTVRLQSSLIKSPVNSSGTGLNIKNLPLLMKFRTRSLRITNRKSHKCFIIGSRRDPWSPRPWSVRDVIAINRLTWIWGLFQFAWLLQSMFGQPPTYRLCANGPYVAEYHDAP